MPPRRPRPNGQPHDRPAARGAPRRRSRAATLLAAVGLLALGAAGAAGAFVFGLVPGFRVVSPIQPLADSPAADGANGAPSAADAIIADSAPPPPDVAADTLAVATANGAVSPADSADGAFVYAGAGRCVSCHGAAGEGVAGLGPNLRDDRWLAGDGSRAAIARAVREGVAPPREYPIAMPAYAGQLAEADIARVAAYVYALSHPTTAPADSTLPDSTRVDRR